MVTRDKAIKYFTEEILNCRLAPKINGCEMREDWQETIDVCELAIAALREQANRENPKPLMLDELMRMDGEPVWIVWPDGRIESKWWIVGNYDWHIMEFDEDHHNYGKTWLAYRSKPKEEQK